MQPVNHHTPSLWSKGLRRADSTLKQFSCASLKKRKNRMIFHFCLLSLEKRHSDASKIDSKQINLDPVFFSFATFLISRPLAFSGNRLCSANFGGGVKEVKPLRFLVGRKLGAATDFWNIPENLTFLKKVQHLHSCTSTAISNWGY